MKIKTTSLGILILGLIFGTVAITSGLGLWVTENTKQAAKFEEGAFVGQADPADIRGSYSFQDIYNNFGVPPEDLGVAFGVADPAQYATFKTNELKALYGELPEGKEVGTSSVRYFVALYKGLPIELTEETYLPKPAVELLKAKASLTPEQLTKLEKIAVELPTPQATATPENTAIPSEPAAFQATPSEDESLYKVSAQANFKDLLDWGVAQEDIEKILGTSMPAPLANIKEHLTDQGLEFSTVKGDLQALVDAVKR